MCIKEEEFSSVSQKFHTSTSNHPPRLVILFANNLHIFQVMKFQLIARHTYHSHIKTFSCVADIRVRMCEAIQQFRYKNPSYRYKSVTKNSNLHSSSARVNLLFGLSTV